MYGISQPTGSRICRRIVHLPTQVLAFTGISLREALDQGHLILADGTFAPTGNRPASGNERANYSGKHHAQCLSIQVTCTATGQLIGTS